jgi:NAD(P)-dependent dehydrogenase (short-subunit alcohol dehydrogenase family)
MLQLEGKVALVTGGASGMGLASSKALAAEGARVIVADIDGDLAEHASASIRENGGDATAYQVDVSKVSELESLFTWVTESFGQLNVLFSHAGIQGAMGLDFTEDEFDRSIDVNLKSHFYATRFALPLLRASAPAASIIFTSSVAGLRSCAPSPTYGATKAAIISFMRSMAVVLGADAIRANAICPGGIETAFSADFIANSGRTPEEEAERHRRAIPMGRIGQPDDVAPIVVFLASDQSRYVTGTSIPVDGGLMA